MDIKLFCSKQGALLLLRHPMNTAPCFYETGRSTGRRVERFGLGNFSEEQAHKWLEGQQEFMHGLCQKSSQDLAPEQAEFKHLFLQTILDSIGAQFFPLPMFFASHVIGLQTENYTSSATPS